MDAAEMPHPTAFALGQRVLVAREPDLEARESAVIKSILAADDGTPSRCTVRFTDGFLRPHVPIDDLAIDEAPPDAEVAKAMLPADSEYDAHVGPLLPAVPSDLDGDAPRANLFAFGGAYKAVGNALFKEEKHAWALRTYLACVQLMQRLGFSGDPEAMVYDVGAAGVCVACFSNAALCALRLGQYEQAEAICDRGLLFAPDGADLGKLLLRKAQSLVERPTCADPERAIELLERAARPEVVGRTRPILVMLQRAKKLERSQQKAADRALFAGGGLGALALATDAVAVADAVRECDDLMRKGFAAILGADPTREVIPSDMREALGHAQPQVDPPAARAFFADAAALAARHDLHAHAAHAAFGAAAAAAEARSDKTTPEEWQTVADGFKAYFDLERALIGGSGCGAADRGAYRAPLLGSAYAHYLAGLAHYNLRHVEDGLASFEAYLSVRASFEEVAITTKDAYGIEKVTEYDRLLKHQRMWAVSPRVEFQARSLLGHLKVHAAVNQPVSAARALIAESVAQHEAAVELAYSPEARQDAEAERDSARKMLQRADEQLQMRPEAEATTDVSDQ